MKDTIGLGVFGTFGEPYGFQQMFYFNAFSQSLDLNTNAIELHPDTTLYAVKREVVNNNANICFCAYSYARELNSSRGGTFIGSCVVLQNRSADAKGIYELLKELHGDLLHNTRNIWNNVIQVQQANQLVVTQPSRYDEVCAKTKATSAAAGSHIDTQKKCLIIPDATVSEESKDKKVIVFFEKALKELKDIDTLYCTFDTSVSDHVSRKGIIPCVGWDEFIAYKATENAKNSKKDNSYSSSHTDNNSQSALHKYNFWEDEKVKWPADKVQQRIIEHNRLVVEFRRLLQWLQHQEQQGQQQGQNDRAGRASESSHQRTDDVMFVILRKHIVFAGVLLLIIGVITIAVVTTRKPAVTASIPQTTQKNEQQKEEQHSEITANKLSPTPNFTLKQRDVTRLAKDNIQQKTLDELIALIFRKNPTDISSYYKGQEKEYGEKLMALNINCFFKNDDGIYVCICDTLEHIPAYKDNK